MFAISRPNQTRSEFDFGGSAQPLQHGTITTTAAQLSTELRTQHAGVGSCSPHNLDAASKSSFGRASRLFSCITKLFKNNGQTFSRFETEQQFSRVSHQYVHSLMPAIRANPAVHAAFHAYVCSPHFAEINIHLRSVATGRPSPQLLARDIPTHISTMQKAFENLKPTKKAFTTLRCVQREALVDMMSAAGESEARVELGDLASLEGKRLKEFGFMSTATTVVGANTGNSGDALLEIEIPKGAKAGAVNMGIDGCTEVLFQPGQTLQINHAYIRNDRLHVCCRLLTQ